MNPEIEVTRWENDHPPEEAKLRARMDEEGLRPYRWSNSPHDVYRAHAHDFHKVIYVVRGSITFGLPRRGEKVHLNVGDRLDLPRGVVHDAVVGPDGVVCLEAHRRR